MEEQSDHVWSTYSTPTLAAPMHARPTCACAEVDFLQACSYACAHPLSFNSPRSTSSWSLRGWKGTGKGDIGGNCQTLFPLYITFLHKSFLSPSPRLSTGEHQEEIPHMLGHWSTTVPKQDQSLTSEEPSRVRRAQTPKQRQGPSGSWRNPHAITSDEGIKRDWSFCFPWLFS